MLRVPFGKYALAGLALFTAACSDKIEGNDFINQTVKEENGVRVTTVHEDLEHVQHGGSYNFDGPGKLVLEKDLMSPLHSTTTDTIEIIGDQRSPITAQGDVIVHGRSDYSITTTGTITIMGDAIDHFNASELVLSGANVRVNGNVISVDINSRDSVAVGAGISSSTVNAVNDITTGPVGVSTVLTSQSGNIEVIGNAGYPSRFPPHSGNDPLLKNLFTAAGNITVAGALTNTGTIAGGTLKAGCFYGETPAQQTACPSPDPMK